ncbi:hypothetical protein [Phocaeicola plebeius]|uniref:hypothetical protein n=1 Tax=Phocaeicola plebeius TaxID=310297 RepID=UPI0026F1F3AA|nr:hypothetical protein [Phocaeicola plebeius]
MKKSKLIIGVLLFVSNLNLYSENLNLKGNSWELSLNTRGTIDYLLYKGIENDTIFFNKHQKFGPVFYISSKRNDVLGNIIQNEEIGTWKKKGDYSYESQIGDLKCLLSYKSVNGDLALDINITNVGNTIVQPLKAGLKLGIDTYMDKFPDWLNAYFPTLLRNEKTHFWGYLMSPKQKIITLSSPDPIASWSLDYNNSHSIGDEKHKPYYWGGHRIEGINIDFINALPLPERCPQNLYQLTPGQAYSWRLFIAPIDNIVELKDVVAKNTKAPFWNIPQTSLAVGEEAKIGIYSETKPTVFNNGEKINVEKSSDGYWTFNYLATEIGHNKLKALANNKVSEAIITVRHSWDWYLDKARSEAERCPQKATTHIESWYGYTSAFIAAKYLPQKDIDKRHSDRFDYLYNLLHKNDVPQIIPYRIQNTSGTIDLLVLKYKAYKNISDLEKASNLADWLIENAQRNDGSFRNYLSKDKNEKKGTLYTSVIYVAKSILDLSIVEKELGKVDKRWTRNYKKHFTAAKKAIDQLVSLHGNLQTEGEMTYEDGMISCTALQIAYLALQEEVGKQRDKYLDEALYILKGHDCLAQLQIPDGRQRGGTLRFWESQYDVLMVPNFMNSPHGWSAWRGYATYYVYLLTGDERWLLESYNAAGAFAELIDTKTGKLRWSFCANPFLPAQMVSEPHPTASPDSITQYHLQPLHYKTNSFIIGEQYVDMISNMMFFNTQDNDVHEVFKFIGEAFLHNAFVVERKDGSLKGYNCNVKRENGIIIVDPNEKLVDNVHINIKGKQQIKIKSLNGEKKYVISGLKWIDL